MVSNTTVGSTIPSASRTVAQDMEDNYQQCYDSGAIPLTARDRALQSASDSEDIRTFMSLEDDSLLSDFLFDGDESMDANLQRTQGAETSKSIRSGKELPGSPNNRGEPIESPLECGPKTEVVRMGEESSTSFEENSDRERDISIAERDTSSVMTKTATFTKLDSSWWEKWNFQKLGRQKLRKLDHRQRIHNRERLRREIHKKLTRIELKSIMLNTQSSYDLRSATGRGALPHPPAPQKSTSVALCCPGLSRKPCKNNLFQRLKKKFRITCRSQEKRARYVLKEEQSRHAYLNRWVQYMKLPPVRKRGLIHFQEKEAQDGMIHLPKGVPGFLQGKLWYIINNKRIDFSHAIGTFSSERKRTCVRDQKTRESLFRQVIKYMDVLQNYPELSWLSPQKSKPMQGVSSWRPARSNAGVVKGELRCSGRYFITRWHYSYNDLIKHPFFLFQSHEITERYQTKGLCNKTAYNVTGKNMSDSTSKERGPSAYKRWKNKRIKRMRSSVCSKLRKEHCESKANASCLTPRRHTANPRSRRTLRNNSPIPDLFNSPDSTTSGSRNFFSDPNRQSSSRPAELPSSRSEEYGKLVVRSTRVQRSCGGASSLRNDRENASDQYTRPKRLDIPLECSSKHQSLYGYVSRTILDRCDKADPRLAASQRAIQVMRTELEKRLRETASIGSADLTEHCKTNQCTHDTLKSSTEDFHGEATFDTRTFYCTSENTNVSFPRIKDDGSLNCEKIGPMSEYTPEISYHSTLPIKEKSDIKNVPIDSGKKETLICCKPNFTPFSDSLATGSTHKEEKYRNESKHCLSPDSTRGLYNQNNANSKTLPRVSRPLRLSHPSIRSCLTKQDTQELLGEMCAVVRPLSPLSEEDASPQAVQVVMKPTTNACEEEIPIRPPPMVQLKTHSNEGSSSTHPLFDVVTMCGAIHGVNHINPCPVPLSCTGSIQYDLCGVTFIQVFGPSQEMEMRVTTENTGPGLTDFANTSSHHKPQIVTSLDDELHEQLVKGEDLSIEAEEIVRGTQACRETSSSTCATTVTKLSSQNLDILVNPFVNVGHTSSLQQPHKSSGVSNFNKHDYCNATSISECAHICQDCNGKAEPECHFTNGESEEKGRQLYDMPLDSSNNHGGRSTEDRQTPFICSEGASEVCLEGTPGTSNTEEDYLFDDMNTPIVLSAADRVYHISGTSCTLNNGLSVCEMPSTRPTFGRDVNRSYYMTDTARCSFSHDILTNTDCTNLPEEHLVISNGNRQELYQDQDLLSKAMHTAGLSDTELETFLTSDSTLEAFLMGQEELSVEAFLSLGQPGSGNQSNAQPAEQHVGGGIDSLGHLSPIPPSGTWYTESIDGGMVKDISTPHIHLDTSPTMYPHTEAFAFTLNVPPQQNEVHLGFSENLSAEYFACMDMSSEHKGTRISNYSSEQEVTQVPLNFLGVNDTNQAACSLYINTDEDEGQKSYLHLDHLMDINVLDIQQPSVYIKKGDQSAMIIEPKVNEQASAESKGRLNNLLMLFDAECHSNEEAASNAMCSVEKAEFAKVNSGNDYQSELEVLDLLPLSPSFNGDKGEEEVEEEEEGSSEGANIWAQNKQTESGIKRIARENTIAVDDTRSVSPQLVSSIPPSWSLRRRELIRTCLEREAVPYVRRSLPPRISRSPPAESESSPCDDMEISQEVFKARSIVRLKENPPSGFCGSDKQTCFSKLKQKKSQPDQVKNKNKRNGDSSVLKHKETAQRKAKNKKQTNGSEKISVKPGSSCKASGGRMHGSLGRSSSSNMERTTRLRTRESKVKGDAAKSGELCVSANSRAEVCTKLPGQSDPQQTSTGISDSYLNGEITKAELFSQQLRSLSPGFLKNISHVRDNFLKPRPCVNKICTKIPRPLAASRRKASRSVVSQRSCQAQERSSGECHNSNNNSIEGVKNSNHVLREVWTVLDLVKLSENSKRSEGADSLIERRTRSKIQWSCYDSLIANRSYDDNVKDVFTAKGSANTRIMEGGEIKGGNYDRLGYKEKHSKATAEQINNLGVDANLKEEMRIIHSNLINSKISSATFTTDSNETKKIVGETKITFSPAFFLCQFTAYNTNNNSNQQDINGHENGNNNQRKEEEAGDQVRKGTDPKLNSIEERPLPARSPIPALPVRDMTWHQREEIKHELPRIGKNMENFHAARRKLKEVNSRLTKIHGKHSFATSPITAPVFSRVLASNNNSVGRRGGGPQLSSLGLVQSQLMSGRGSIKDRLTENISSMNVPKVKDLEEIKYSSRPREESLSMNSRLRESPTLNLEEGRNTKGMFSPSRWQSARQKGEKLQNSLNPLKVGGRESKNSPYRYTIGQEEISRNSKHNKETITIGDSSKMKTRIETRRGLGERMESWDSSNSDRDVDISLIRFVERLNSDYGQQLTKDTPQKQARLDHLCSRYLESVRVRKSLQEKLMGNVRSTFNRGDIRAALEMNTASTSRNDLQKRKKMESSFGDVHETFNIPGGSIDTDFNNAKATSRNRDINENMKRPGRGGSPEKYDIKTGDNGLSKRMLYSAKDSITKFLDRDRDKNMSIPSVTTDPPLRRSPPTFQCKATPALLKTVNSKRMSRVKSASQLRPHLRESVERLSSRTQSPVARLQYDISMWEANFGKYFSLRSLDGDKASGNDSRLKTRPASSSSNITHSSRPVARQSRDKKKGMSKTEGGSSLNKMPVKSYQSPESKGPKLPRWEQCRESREDKIDTFFGSLLNLIDQKESQKTKGTESCTSAKAQPRLRSTTKINTENKERWKETKKKGSQECREVMEGKWGKDGKEGKDDKDDKEGKEDKESKEGKDDIESKEKRNCTEGSSTVGAMYRRMLETVKAKRSSLVVDMEDPWVIPPLSSFKEMSESPESMLNLPNHLQEPKPEGTDNFKPLEESAIKTAAQEQHQLTGDMADITSDVVPKKSDMLPFTDHNPKIVISEEKHLSPKDSHRCSPNCLQEKDAKRETVLLPVSPNVRKVENVDSEKSLARKKDTVHTEGSPKSLTGSRNGSHEQEGGHISLPPMTEGESNANPSTLAEHLKKCSPKVALGPLGGTKSPAIATSAVSVSSSISYSLGGGDNVDNNFGPIVANTVIADNYLFADGPTILEGNAPIERLDCTREGGVSKLESPKVIEPNANIVKETSSEHADVFKDEYFKWTRSKDSKSDNDETLPNKRLSSRSWERKHDGTDMARFESPDDLFHSHDSVKRDYFKFPETDSVKNGYRDDYGVRGATNFDNSQRNLTESYNYREGFVDFRANNPQRFQDDKRQIPYDTRAEGVTLEIPRSVNDPNRIDRGPASQSEFSSRNSMTNMDFNSFSSKASDFDSSHGDYEIKSLDALERQAEHDFGAMYRRPFSAGRQHETVTASGRSALWQEDSRDEHRVSVGFGGTDNQLYQAPSSYQSYGGYSPSRATTGLNWSGDTTVTDTRYSTYSYLDNGYLAGSPMTNQPYTTEKSYSGDFQSFAHDVGSTVASRAHVSPYFTSSSRPVAGIAEGTDSTYSQNTRSTNSSDRQPTDIPWDQLAAVPQTTPSGQHSLTAFDIARRSLGHSYLAPIQEESEEDQRPAEE